MKTSYHQQNQLQGMKCTSVLNRGSGKNEMYIIPKEFSIG